MSQGKNKKKKKVGSKAPKPPDPSKKLPIFPIVIGIVIVLGVGAIFMTRKGTKPPQFNNNTSVDVSGGQLPPLPEGSKPDPAAGMVAPELTGTTLSGKPISILNTGKPKVVMLIAHWCPHCQKEVPMLQQWADANGVPQGVELYAIATSNDPTKPNYPPTDWLDSVHWTAPTMVDSPGNTGANAFGLTGFPFWVIIDADGKIVSRQAGEISEQDIPKVFAQALVGTPSSPVSAPNSSSSAK